MTAIFIIAGCSQTGTGGNIKACTEEAKLCPDGSAVGRTGPNCEFAACPVVENTSTSVCGGWNQVRETICQCSGKYEKPSCPADVMCDSGDYFCHGTCGECKCYEGPEWKGVPCPGENAGGSAGTTPETNAELCGNMTLAEAERIAKASECGDRLKNGCACPKNYRQEEDTCTPECYYGTPRCLAPSIQCEKSHFCNEGTGTWWINLDITKEGCAPACVIHTDTKQAEINWRCTGLVQN